MPFEYNAANHEFLLRHIRFSFVALEPQTFADGKAGNVFRGALGWALKEVSPEGYERFFEPRQAPGGGPSGFANRPRPFVLRASHLEGKTFERGESFRVDLHLFRNAPEELFTGALERIRVGRLSGIDSQAVVVSLVNRNRGIRSLQVCFATPTELKTDGELAEVPLFATLFSRARDRIRALAGHPLDLDFAGMAERARNISLVSHDLKHVRFARTSSKNKQTHPLGGFRGDAFYAGDLDEFIPLLEAACWTGVGRQTVWGKGAIQVSYPA
jgi:CRISPR-associated endoribonuclease Cas6